MLTLMMSNMAIRIKTKSVDWASAISKTPIVFLRSILICVGLILLGCSPPTTAPDWIDTPPRSNSYWYGVGVVSEPLTGEKAIANLAEDLYNNTLPEIIGAFHE